jgi:EpsD family peptidyl-prolyl cis-trans isomerase
MKWRGWLSCLSAAWLLASGASHAQVAALVNKEWIMVDQVDYMMAQMPAVNGESPEAARKAALDRLIDIELARQQAVATKLDQDPAVQRMVDAAKAAALAQGYMIYKSRDVPKPTEAEIKRYYFDHPALFSERRVFSIQELAAEVPPDQVPKMKARLAKEKNMGGIVLALKANGFKYNANQAVRTAEQLPMTQLDSIHKLKDGEIMVEQIPQGLHVVALTASETKPASLDMARPFIERFLVNDRRKQIVDSEAKALRAGASIEYPETNPDVPEKKR